jgi:hypothetical protein
MEAAAAAPGPASGDRWRGGHPHGGDRRIGSQAKRAPTEHPAVIKEFVERGDEYLDSRREIGWEILNDCAKISRETERSR